MSPPARCPRTVAIALIHHPVLGRDGRIITTAITNLDVHDIARSACTYGVQRVYLVHPVEAQRDLVTKITGHWTTGAGARRIPDRVDALSLVMPTPSLDDAITHLRADGPPPDLWTTAAAPHGDVVPYPDARTLLWQPGPPVLLLFGTGWGLPGSTLAAASVRLAPILGVTPWNHLSVRAACAISLDRLLG